MSDPRAKPLAEDDMTKKLMTLIKNCISTK